MVDAQTIRDINRQLYSEVRPDVKKSVSENFEKIKAQMIKEFESHSVTKELDAGPGARNISGTLNKGNLFSFIGFDRGDKPTEIIRRKLHEARAVITKGSRGVFNIDVSIPTAEELFDITPLPWADGRSWLRGIELGMSGMGRFMYGEYPEGSRSGKGIQIKSNMGGKFRNISYISAILSRAKKEIERMRL